MKLTRSMTGWRRRGSGQEKIQWGCGVSSAVYLILGYRARMPFWNQEIFHLPKSMGFIDECFGHRNNRIIVTCRVYLFLNKIWENILHIHQLQFLGIWSSFLIQNHKANLDVGSICNEIIASPYVSCPLLFISTSKLASLLSPSSSYVFNSNISLRGRRCLPVQRTSFGRSYVACWPWLAMAHDQCGGATRSSLAAV
jgi:hypothetical protein